MQHMERSSRLVAVLAALTVGTGCGVSIDADDGQDGFRPRDGDPSTGVTKSTLQCELAGGGHPLFERADVEIQRIELLGDDEVVLTEHAGRFNLLELDAEVTALLARAELEPGCYRQLRLVVRSAEVTLREGLKFSDDSRTRTLRVPSGAQSGIKVNLVASAGTEQCRGGVDLSAGPAVLVVVFDPESNFVVQGNPDTPAGLRDVTFTPSLRAFVRDVSASISGEVRGAEGADLDVDGLTVRAEQLESDLPSELRTADVATTVDEGAYALRFLAPGKYRVRLEVPEGFRAEPADHEVRIGDGEDRGGVDFVVVRVADTEPRDGVVSGTVRFEGGDPPALGDLEVRAAPLGRDGATISRRLDEDGRYALELAPGKWRVTVEVPAGFEPDPDAQEVDLSADQRLEGVDFVLRARPGPDPGPDPERAQVIGRVILDIGVEIDLAGAEVECASADAERETVTAQVNADGEFRVELDPGRWELRLDLPRGFEMDPLVVDLEPGETEEVELRVTIDVDVDID